MMRTLCRWGLLSFSCVALLTASAQTGRPQPPPVPMPPPLGGGKSAPVVPTPNLIPTTFPLPTPTVEDLIKQLETLRKEKADLEKKERDLVTKLQERMKDQTDRLNKLGIILAAPRPEAKEPWDTVTPLLKTPSGQDKVK